MLSIHHHEWTEKQGAEEPKIETLNERDRAHRKGLLIVAASIFAQAKSLRSCPCLTLRPTRPPPMVAVSSRLLMHPPCILCFSNPCLTDQTISYLLATVPSIPRTLHIMYGRRVKQTKISWLCSIGKSLFHDFINNRFICVQSFEVKCTSILHLHQENITSSNRTSTHPDSEYTYTLF